MIDVAFTPSSIPPASVTVMIDVLRASSSIVQALAAGYRRVLCCRTLEEAEAMRGDGRVIAGERGCVKPAGFDLGNSPAGFQQHPGGELVLTTTNGCPALLAAAACSEEVLVGCLLNFRSVLTRLDPAAEVVLVCAGTDGAPALEDVYLAGRIVAALPGAELTDAARVAVSVAGAYAKPIDALEASADARALRRVGLERDVSWCARESALGVVGRVSRSANGVATVVEAGASVGPSLAGQTVAGPSHNL